MKTFKTGSLGLILFVLIKKSVRTFAKMVRKSPYWAGLHKKNRIALIYFLVDSFNKGKDFSSTFKLEYQKINLYSTYSRMLSVNHRVDNNFSLLYLQASLAHIFEYLSLK